VRSTTIRSLTAILGTGLLLAVSACSPAADADPELDTGAAKMTIEEWRQDVDDCMLDAGYDLVAMSEGGGTTPSMTSEESAAFDTAYTACIDDIGEAPVDENMPSEDEMFEAQLAFAACMREAGYDYPDPVKGSGMSEALGPEIDPDVVDTCYAKSQEAVQ